MNNVTFKIVNIKILKTGVDGGHLYLKAKTQFQNENEVDAYCYFKDKIDEKTFENEWGGQDLSVTSSNYEFTKGVGLSIHAIEYKPI